MKQNPVAEFKEFERRFKIKLRFKYCWFHLKLYQMFQRFNPAINLNRVFSDLNRGLNSNSELFSVVVYLRKWLVMHGREDTWY